MKKRNKHFLKEKEFIRLKKELDTNLDAQHKLGWIQLEKPKHIGWIAKLSPREDILNRDDSWVFEGISELFGTTCYAKKIELFEWNLKKKKSKFIPLNIPHIRSISQSQFESLVPQAKKYFKNDLFHWSNRYVCTIPNFYWEIKYEKNYQTKVKISDCILEQEEAEIEYQIEKKFYSENKWCKGAPKWFRKKLNRQQRAKSKQTLYNIVINKKDVEFVDDYRGARWDWW